jgi:hypothetical protein
MKTVTTIKLKIPYRQEILATMEQYSHAVSYIAHKGYSSNVYKRYDLHHLCYYDTRGRFSLPSQFVINAIRVASQTLKSVKTKNGSEPQFQHHLPLPFDRRTFTFSFDRVRLTTIAGRIDIPLDIP